jgi:hypothetical protein
VTLFKGVFYFAFLPAFAETKGAAFSQHLSQKVFFSTILKASGDVFASCGIDLLVLVQNFVIFKIQNSVFFKFDFGHFWKNDFFKKVKFYILKCEILHFLKKKLKNTIKTRVNIKSFGEEISQKFDRLHTYDLIYSNFYFSIFNLNFSNIHKKSGKSIIKN